MKAEELAEWVNNNIPTQEWSCSADSPIKALMWAMALSDADSYLDDLTQRHLAEWLLDGIPPLNETDLEEWAESFRESDDPEGDLPRELQSYLREFWKTEGVKIDG